MLVVETALDKPKWTLIHLAKNSDITASVSKTTVYGVIAISVVCVLFLLFSIFFFSQIINPVKLITEKMKAVEREGYAKQIEPIGRGEIFELTNTFNRMTGEIIKRGEERDKKEKERLSLELQMLQYQITPHFIINTLNSIKIMAQISAQTNIVKITEAFMRLLASVLGKKGNMATVGEEIENIRHYVYIMKIRFGEKFDVQYELEDGIGSLPMLSFLFQPIVENAIIHGFCDMYGGGLLVIRGYRAENKLIFEITDNGGGIDERTLERIMDEKTSVNKGFLSMGVYNVEQRIKLNYGDEYGLTITSRKNESTRVTLRLPVLPVSLVSDGARHD